MNRKLAGPWTNLTASAASLNCIHLIRFRIRLPTKLAGAIILGFEQHRAVAQTAD